jgi:hypothetical protein
MARIHYSRFAVHETPYCLWDWNIRKLNLDFLETINPGYFEHVANIHGQALESDEKQYAATALRVAYSHGLESLFTLLCAMVQAPDCVAGWLLKYRNKELFDVVRKIDQGSPVYTIAVFKSV